MHGKYFDQRVYPHFVHIYSKVPYLDREIFNVSTDALRLSRRADQRANQAIEGIIHNIQEFKKLLNNLRISLTLSGTLEEKDKKMPPSS